MAEVLGGVSPAGHFPVHQVNGVPGGIDNEVARIDLGIDDTGPGVFLVKVFPGPRFRGPGQDIL